MEKTPLLDKAQQNLEGEKLQLIYVRLSDLAFWSENPKKHDIEGLIQSMKTHGFRDAPIWDDNLNNGKGGIAGGNGRLEALKTMMETEKEPPRGILVHKESGEWCIPIQFGINAENQDKAEAFAVDHNNLTLGGSELSAVDRALLWDDNYPYLLERLGSHDIVSVSEEDMDILKKWQEPPTLDELADEVGEPDDRDFWPEIKEKVAPEIYHLWQDMINFIGGDDRTESAKKILTIASKNLEGFEPAEYNDE